MIKKKQAEAPANNVWSEQKFVATNRRGHEFPPTRFAIGPEPEGLACLADICEEEFEDPVFHYAQYLNQHGSGITGFAEGFVPIYWTVRMEGNGDWLSPIPNPDLPGRFETWHEQGWRTPFDAIPGEPIDWYGLPIAHRFPEFWRELEFDPAPFQRRFEFRETFRRDFAIEI